MAVSGMSTNVTCRPSAFESCVAISEWVSARTRDVVCLPFVTGLSQSHYRDCRNIADVDDADARIGGRREETALRRNGRVISEQAAVLQKLNARV